MRRRHTVNVRKSVTKATSIALERVTLTFSREGRAQIRTIEFEMNATKRWSKWKFLFCHTTAKRLRLNTVSFLFIHSILGSSFEFFFLFLAFVKGKNVLIKDFLWFSVFVDDEFIIIFQLCARVASIAMLKLIDGKWREGKRKKCLKTIVYRSIQNVNNDYDNDKNVVQCLFTSNKRQTKFQFSVLPFPMFRWQRDLNFQSLEGVLHSWNCHKNVQVLQPIRRKKQKWKNFFV